MLGPINLDIAFAFLQARPTMLRGDLLTNRLLRLQQVRSILRLASKPDNLGRKSLKRIKELTFKFSGSAASLFGDSFPFLGVDSIEGHNRVSSKGFPTTGPRIEAGNVVIHRGLHTPMPDVRYSVVMLMGYVVDWNCMSMDLKVLRTRLICASFGSTRLICAPFGSTRLISASLGITRLIGVSFVITRLMCAFYGTARLLCRVRVQRRADRREAGRMREGHMDASGFLYASADGKCRQGGVHVGVAEEAEEGEQDVFNLRCSL
ncbi:hypothetical protein E5676_scaffold343G00510 [Cucumis melo var. makuwa]|uniref:Ty3-gypsy retrotransposon protein n=1 Tax=Cucumis melo var. makuwa TaxID=1194695 RepID=A0A5D3E4H7_CUCMM|nr:hypothetical protein E5676_scaffold343G00510 [Cucumis melo var. makuwa]